MNWKGILGLLFIGVGIILTIVSMATLSWLSNEDPASNTSGVKTTINYGLVQYRVCTGNVCATKSIASLCSDVDNEFCDRVADGGKQVIACGIVSLVVAVTGFVFTVLAYKKGRNLWRFLAILSWFIAGALAILAVILYSKKTVRLDYGFILYLFASFTTLIGSTVVLVGPGVQYELK